MSARAALKGPGVLRALALSAAARLPLTSVGLVLILHARHLDMSFAVAGMTSGALTLGMAVGAPLMGRLVDRRGQMLVLSATCVVSGVALIMAATVVGTSELRLIALSAVAGLAQPPIAACVRVVLANLVSGPARDSVFALDIVVHQIAFLVGPAAFVSVATMFGPPVALEVIGTLLVCATIAFAASPEARAWKGKALTSSEMTNRAGIRGRVGVITHPGVVTVVAMTSTIGLMFGILEVGVAAAHERDSAGIPLGAMYGVWSLGAVATGLAIGGRRSSCSKVREAHWLVAIAVVCSLLLAIPLPTWWLVPTLLLHGAAVTPLSVLLYAMMADVAPDDGQTEAFAWEVTGMQAGIAVGAGLSGFAVSVLVGPSIFLLAVAALLANTLILITRRATVVDDRPAVRGIRPDISVL